MKKSEIYNKILDKIKSSQNILITTHENPDGDAISSVCAMAELMKSMGKTCWIFCPDEPEASFHFLPHVEKIKIRRKDIFFSDLDLVVAVDCCSLQRSRIEDDIRQAKLYVINIDHHASNNQFGDINLVDADAVATTQILYEIFRQDGVNINRHMANCILTGIVTDSGNFAYTATDPHVFSVASEMLIEGANVRDILNYTAKNKNLTTLKAWGFALSRLQHNKYYDIAYTILTQKDLQEFGVTKQDLEGLANFLNNLKDAKIVLVLYELGDGRVKGSLRTNRNDIDVSKLAQLFNGGGHTKASGFEIDGELKQIGDSWKIN